MRGKKDVRDYHAFSHSSEHPKLKSKLSYIIQLHACSVQTANEKLY